MKYFVFTIYVFYTTLSFAQIDSTENFVLPELKITQNVNGKNVTYEFSSERNLFSVSDSFLVANLIKYNYKVNIADFRKLTIIRSSGVAPTMVVTFGVGFLLGYGLQGIDLGGGHSVSTGQRVLGGLIVGSCLSFVAGAIALLISHDKAYDLSKYNFTEKRNLLMKALKENKLK